MKKGIWLVKEIVADPEMKRSALLQDHANDDVDQHYGRFRVCESQHVHG